MKPTIHTTHASGEFRNRWYFPHEIAAAQAAKASLEAQGFYTSLDFYESYGQWGLVWSEKDWRTSK